MFKRFVGRAISSLHNTKGGPGELDCMLIGIPLAHHPYPKNKCSLTKY